MSKKKMFTQNDELVEFAAAIKTISDEEMEAKFSAIAEQEMEDAARYAGRRPIRVVEDTEDTISVASNSETVVAYDGTKYTVPADDVTDIHRRPLRARNGDKADHRARKAAYEALKRPHESRYEWRRDFDSLERLTKYGAKHLGDYCYVAKVMACNRDDRLADGRGYDTYCHGDRFAKPVLREKVKAADAMRDTEILPEDIGSLWDMTDEDLYEVIETYDFDDGGYEVIIEKELPKEQFKTSWLASSLVREAEKVRYDMLVKIANNVPIPLTAWEIRIVCEKGLLSEKAFDKTAQIKKRAENLLDVVKDAKRLYAEDNEAIDYLNKAYEILEWVINVLP